MMRSACHVAFWLSAALLALPVARSAAGDRCLSGASAVQDRAAIDAVRADVAANCDCPGALSHRSYVACARSVITAATDASSLRPECERAVLRFERRSTCGFVAQVDPTKHRAPCLVRSREQSARLRCRITRLDRCVSKSRITRVPCTLPRWPYTHCIDAADSNGDLLIAAPLDEGRCALSQKIFDIPSAAQPAETPGTPGVVVTNPKLLTQFGGADFNLNNARYTRWRFAGIARQPDGIFIAVAGFGGGANNFKILAENLLPRMLEDHGLVFEVWGFHRRTNQLEDTAGVAIATELVEPLVALDWYFGADLGLSLHPALVAGPNRRAVFYNDSGDIPFLANFTSHVFSQDIDAVVEVARSVARNSNVFLGGHSAGTGFTARYAATDFNPTGVGAPEPGHGKLRGLLLLEGGGGFANTPLSDDALDRVIAKFDGGLFGAVRDGAPRCVDGTTPCSVADEATDCAGQTPPKCTPPATAYRSALPGVGPAILATSEVVALQGITDPDGGQIILQVDQGAPGNSAVEKVPDLALLGLLQPSTVYGLLGAFLDDEGLAVALSPAVATTVGAPGPIVNGLATWLDITEGPLPPEVLPNNGPPPTTLPAGNWGQEVEVVRLDRMTTTFLASGANAADWYFASAGLGVTSAPGVCDLDSGVCTAGNVGAACANDGQCTQSISLDSSSLSLDPPAGRGRRDIVNLTQAGTIDIPVLCLGGSDGLTRSTASYLAFGQSLGICTAPSCDGSTPRVVDANLPNPAFPTFGGIEGGFEVYIQEGLAHADMSAAEDNADTMLMYQQLSDFFARNVQ